MTFSSYSSQDNQANQLKVHFPKADDAMTQTYAPSVDCIIYQEVIGLVSCTLDELVQQLPGYSWAQVFAAVDRLSRRGTLKLSRTGRFGYVLSACSDPPHSSPHDTGGAQGCVNWTGDPILAGK
jgi:predicted DNA-binding transcriptional regulator